LAFDRKVIQRIDIDKMWEHLEILTENIGPRVMGTSEELDAADYIASVFESYGYDVSFFDFLLPENRIVPEVEVLVPVEDKLFPAPLRNTGLTSGDGITSQVIDWGDSLDPPTGASGKIALMDSPPGANRNTNYDDQREAALNAGAVSVILIQSTDSGLGGRLSEPPSLPMIILSPSQGEQLRTLVENDAVIVNIQLEAGGTSSHVIATREPQNKNKSTDEVLIIGAHYDSVYGAPGANDNASSVVVMLELARVFANYPIDRDLRFMAFGAEEGGGGSFRYVESLSEDEKAKISMINMEMLGSIYEPQEKTFSATADGSTNFMTDAFVDAGARFVELVPFAGPVCCSDHVPFHVFGMPSIVYARAYPGIIPWDPEGRFGLEWWYHTPLDTLERMSAERLEEAAKIAGAAAYDIIRMDTPNLDRSAIRRDLDFTGECVCYPPAYEFGEGSCNP
jgi:aminopeptidase YwaD